MNLFQNARAWLAPTLAAACSPVGAVTYTRRAGGVVDLTGKCWVGRTVYRRNPPDGDAGPAVVFGGRDYLIPAEHLGGRKPERGDRVAEVLDGVTRIYEVTSVMGEPEQRWSDPSEAVYRVHTKPRGYE